MIMAGEYGRMQETFGSLARCLVLAALLMYCVMVALARSFVVPMTVMLAVPISLGGVLPMLYLTGTAINVQSLLGIIFVIGINVPNTVLMTDLAQVLRRNEGLSPTDAIRKAAALLHQVERTLLAREASESGIAGSDLLPRHQIEAGLCGHRGQIVQCRPRALGVDVVDGHR